jgi:translation initiation factor IF-3
LTFPFRPCYTSRTGRERKQKRELLARRRRQPGLRGENEIHGGRVPAVSFIRGSEGPRAGAAGGVPPSRGRRGGDGNPTGGARDISRDLRVNHEIRAREVRLIDDEGRQLGVMPLREALRVAAERGLDLVEVAPTAQPVVCRIMDWGRFKYEQAKREREARRKQHIVGIKELKMRPSIEDHDFDVKARNAERFLRDGDKVKVTVMFRGREIVHANLGREVLQRLAERLRSVGAVEQEPRVEGRNMVMVIAPRPEVLRAVRADTRGDGQAAGAPVVSGGAPEAG